MYAGACEILCARLNNIIEKNNVENRDLCVTRILCAVQLLSLIPFNTTIMHKLNVVNDVFREINNSIDNPAISGT